MWTSSKLCWLKVLVLAAIATVATPRPGNSVERITLHYPPFKDVSISVRDLEDFAKEGKIAPDFAIYFQQATPAQIQLLRQSLQQRLEISPRYVTQLVRSPLVERLLERLGEIVLSDSSRNGKQPLQSALIGAAVDKRQGLTPINFLRQFPGRQMNLNLSEGFAIYANLSELLKRRDTMIVSLNQIADAEAATDKTDFASKLDLTTAGAVRWQKQKFDWLDRVRQRRVLGDLYLPQTNSTEPIRAIAISHGVAEDRTAFAYLAQHLASYGFAVVVVEHVGGDAHRFRQYFSGLAPAPAATELLDRPRDISFVLDELQRRAQSDPVLGQLDLSRVGAIGHSLGGYTILSLAGAEIDFERIEQNCNPNRSLNLSVLLQCRANELRPRRYALQDPRIQAIFAINPLGNTMFGLRGIGQIRIPTLLMGGSDDVVTPAVPEQIYPFTWLQTPDKYLAILEKGTHFSTPAVAKNDAVFPVSDSLIGPEPQLARTYTKALSIAFFQTHLAGRSEFRTYLNPAYGRALATQQPAILSRAVPMTAFSDLERDNRVRLRLNLVQASASDRISQILQQASFAAKLTP